MLVLVHVYLLDLEHDPFITQSLNYINCPIRVFKSPFTQVEKYHLVLVIKKESVLRLVVDLKSSTA